MANRPLEEIYPILYLDCLVVKVRQDKRVINKSVYLALAVNLEGRKGLLGGLFSAFLIEVKQFVKPIQPDKFLLTSYQ